MLDANPASTQLVVSAVRCTDCAEPCGPDCAYRIAWRINPHMRVGEACPERAERQSSTFVSKLREAGAAVTELPFVHGRFDSVFVKDVAIFKRERGRIHALLAKAKHPERAAERDHRAAHLEARGVVVEDSAPAELEGGDVLVLEGCALLGVGPRSSRESLRVLSRFLGKPVVALELVDSALYHLDTALGALSDGKILACREAFSSHAWALLERLFTHDLIAVPRAEALRFALNWVEVGDQVILGCRSAWMSAMLQLLDRKPVNVDLSEFVAAGGSAACLTARAA